MCLEKIQEIKKRMAILNKAHQRHVLYSIIALISPMIFVIIFNQFLLRINNSYCEDVVQITSLK